jgi:HEAT repeat protein
MTRALPILGCLVLLAAVVVAQQPTVQNTRVESRKVSALERDVMALGGAATDPVWIGWRVPVVGGDRELCSSWNTSRGDFIELNITGTITSSEPRQFAAPTGPVPLEGGASILVLLRFDDGRLERLRTVGGDCPIDAGGRTLHWIDAVAPADSLRFLDGLTRVDGPDSVKALTARRTLASSALSSIALHRDAGADTILERIAGDRNDTLRASALRLLGSHRGARGFAALDRQLKGETDNENRRLIVSAIGASREPGVTGVLKPLLRDGDAKVRAEAVARYIVLGGPPVIAEALAIINADPVDDVKTRAVSSIAAWPRGEGIPHLIALARTTKDPVVQRRAVSSLSSSRDPRALAYLEELLKK